MQENQSALEVWDFHTTSHGGLLSGNQMGVCWVVWLNHGGGHSYLPCELSLHNPENRKKDLPHPTSLQVLPTMGGYLVLIFQLPFIAAC